MANATVPAPSPGAGAPGDFAVLLPSGALQPVLTAAEQQYLEQRIALYHEHLALTNVSDLADLDRVMVMELLMYRWGVWLGAGEDYDHEPFDDRIITQQLKEANTELRQLKKNLGIDRPARERQKGEGSWPHHYANLLARAKAFGVMRCQQLDRALELTNELIGLVQRHDNATEREKHDLHCTPEDIIEWIRDIYTPEYQEIDAYFREHEQRYWIRDMG